MHMAISHLKLNAVFIAQILFNFAPLWHDISDENFACLKEREYQLYENLDETDLS